MTKSDILFDYLKKTFVNSVNSSLMARNALLPISNYRIVYGGGRTILINKETRKRACMVTREYGELDSLKRAVLYLVLKFKGIGGKQIEDWSKPWMFYATTHMKAEFEAEFLKWFVNNTYQTYSDQQINDIIDGIYRWSGDRLNSFMYFILEDRFKITRKDINELIDTAVCSEKVKKEKTLGEKLMSGEIDSTKEVKVEKIQEEVHLKLDDFYTPPKFDIMSDRVISTFNDLILHRVLTNQKDIQKLKEDLAYCRTVLETIKGGLEDGKK